MSESLALFRPNQSKELRQLAEEHLQHEYVDFRLLLSSACLRDAVSTRRIAMS